MATQGSSPKKAAAKKAAKKAPATRAVSKKAGSKAAAPKKAPPKKAAAAKATRAKAPAAKTAKAAAPKKAAGTSKKSADVERNGAEKPAKPAKSPFSAAFLKKQKELLLAERATYLHQAEVLQAEAESLVDDFVSGDVQFDEESGEGDTLNIERERDLTLSAQAREAVAEIDHALAKFELGTYGICETSGLPIPEERLEAIPWARQRVEYKVAGLGRR